VVANMNVSGANAQVASRLWDVGPNGRAVLIARGLYRPRPDQRQVFQLHPNAWHFDAGHKPKLELLGRDAPYARPSNGAFSVTVSDLDLRLPVRESLATPAPIFAPTGQQLAPDVVSMRLRVKYTRGKGARRSACARWTKARAKVIGKGLRNVKHVTFRLGRKRMKRDTQRPFQATIRPKAVTAAKSRKLRARARTNDGRRVVAKRKLRAC
jgi:ribosomal protein L34